MDGIARGPPLDRDFDERAGCHEPRCGECGAVDQLPAARGELQRDADGLCLVATAPHRWRQRAIVVDRDVLAPDDVDRGGEGHAGHFSTGTG